MERTEAKKIVRESYASIAKQGNSCCPGGAATSSCGCGNASQAISKAIGYSSEDIASVPAGADLGLGCGNPVALASLRQGETVLDLGSGAGFDCFLAAKKVGPTGRVIGVDMTPEMIGRARENAVKGGYGNVQFRLGEIEHLPVADGSVDAIISTCVINLCADKARVFEEASRVLRPGGRVTISDIVLLRALPASLKNSVQGYVGCISGAMLKHEYLETIEKAGFHDVTVIDESAFPVELMAEDPTARAVMKSLNMAERMGEEVAASIVSLTVQGIRRA